MAFSREPQAEIVVVEKATDNEILRTSMQVVENPRTMKGRSIVVADGDPRLAKVFPGVHLFGYDGDRFEVDSTADGGPRTGYVFEASCAHPAT